MRNPFWNACAPILLHRLQQNQWQRVAIWCWQRFLVSKRFELAIIMTMYRHQKDVPLLCVPYWDMSLYRANHWYLRILFPMLCKQNGEVQLWYKPLANTAKRKRQYFTLWHVLWNVQVKIYMRLTRTGWNVLVEVSRLVPRMVATLLMGKWANMEEQASSLKQNVRKALLEIISHLIVAGFAEEDCVEWLLRALHDKGNENRS